MNLKHLNLVIHLSPVVISGLSLVAVMKTAQAEPACFLTQPSGQITDLGSLCENNRQQELRSTMEPQALLQQGITLGKQGFYQEAVTSFTQAIAIAPNFAEGYAFRGQLRILQDNAQEAMVDLQKAVELFKRRGDLTMANAAQQLIEDTREEFRLGK